MANTPSAKKAARRIARRSIVNKARRSRVKTHVRKVENAILANDHSCALNALKTTESEIMRAVAKGVLHRNTGARKVSRLALRVHKIANSPKH